MVESDSLRDTKLALNNGSGAIPALGFGTLIPDPIATRTATKAALEAASLAEAVRGEDVPGGLLRFAREQQRKNMGGY